MDFIGTILFLGAVCCLTLALQWGGTTRLWRSPTIIALLAVFGILTIGFCAVQYRRRDDALIPVRVLSQRSILVGALFLFFTGMFNYVVSDALTAIGLNID
jgi:hypothetical protein